MLRIITFDQAAEKIDMSRFHPKTFDKIGITGGEAQGFQSVVAPAQLSSICLCIQIVQEKHGWRLQADADKLAAPKGVINVKEGRKIGGQPRGNPGAISKFEGDEIFRSEVFIT